MIMMDMYMIHDCKANTITDNLLNFMKHSGDL